MTSVGFHDAHSPRRSLFWLITVGLWALPLAPLIVTRETHYSYTLGRTIFFRIDTEILLLLYVALIFLDKKFRPPANSLVWSVVAYSGAVVLTTVVSLDPPRSWWGTLERMDGGFAMLHYSAFFLILAGVFRTRKDWAAFFNVSLGVSLLVAANAVTQRLNMGLSRTGSMLGAPSFAATYAIFQIFFAVMVAHWGKAWGSRLWGAIALAVNLLTLFLTATRGGILGLCAGILAFAIAVLVWEKENARLRRAAALVIILLLGAPLAARAARRTAAVRWNYALERLSEISLADRSSNTRLIALGVSWKAFQARPLFGYGPEMFPVAYSRYFNPEQLTYEQGWFDHAHNKLADVLVMQGLVGFVPYLGIFVAASWLLYATLKRRPSARMCILATFGMLVAYFVQNLFLFDLPTSYVMFYALLGFITFLSRETAPAPQAAPANSKGSRQQPRLGVWQRWIVGSLAALSISSIYEFNLKAFAEAERAGDFEASIHDPQTFLDLFRRAVSYRSWPTHEVTCMAADDLLASDKVNEPGYAGVFNEVAAEVERQVVGRNDLDPRNHIRLGALYNRMALVDRANLTKAEKILNTAIQMAPKWPESYDALGENYLLQGKTDEAFSLFKQAIDINPRNGGAHWLYAFPLLANHREQEGFAELEAAVRNYNYHNRDDLMRLARVYYQFRKFPKAIEYETELVELEPAAASHHAALAELYKDSGNVEEARREMRVAAQLEPHYSSRARAFMKNLQTSHGPKRQSGVPNP